MHQSLRGRGNCTEFLNVVSNEFLVIVSCYMHYRIIQEK